MTLTIRHTPNVQVNMFRQICVNINHSVQRKMKDGEELTKDLGLKILKKIQMESHYKARLTKPAVVLPVTLGVAVSALVIPSVIGAMSAAVLAIAALVYSVVCAIFVYTFIHTVDGNLGKLSKAYKDESEHAEKYYNYLKNADDVMLEADPT